MKAKWLAAMALAILVTPLCGLAQEGPPGRRGQRPEGGPRGQEFGGQGAMGMAGSVMRLQKELNVTDEQREQIRAIMEANRETGRAVMEKMRDAHQALRELAESDEVNEAAIRAKAAEVGAALGDSALMQAKVRKNIRAVLTADQIKKLDEMRDKMRERMEQRRKERAEGREGGRRGGRRGGRQGGEDEDDNE